MIKTGSQDCLVFPILCFSLQIGTKRNSFSCVCTRKCFMHLPHVVFVTWLHSDHEDNLIFLSDSEFFLLSSLFNESHFFFISTLILQNKMLPDGGLVAGNDWFRLTETIKHLVQRTFCTKVLISHNESERSTSDVTVQIPFFLLRTMFMFHP